MWRGRSLLLLPVPMAGAIREGVGRLPQSAQEGDLQTADQPARAATKEEVASETGHGGSGTSFFSRVQLHVDAAVTQNKNQEVQDVSKELGSKVKASVAH